MIKVPPIKQIHHFWLYISVRSEEHKLASYLKLKIWLFNCLFVSYAFWAGIQLETFLKDGGSTRPIPMDGRVEELYGDPTVGPHPKVWTRGQKWKK